MADEIQLDGDPRTLALAIFRAALAAYREQHGDPDDPVRARAQLEVTIPKLARQMVEALEQDVRDVYLMNALEVMALNYAKRELKPDRVGAERENTSDAPILKVDGLLERAETFSYPDLKALPDQIPDVGRILPDRRGEGIWLRVLLGRVTVKPGTTHAVFHALDGQFSARVPLTEALEKGFFVYRLDGQPLPESLGGPLRLLIPGADDRCANVKGVSRIEITAE